ncbi:non-homologous end-joining DNA ligase [Mycobacterium sp. SMC-17]|uniref:non-homologous end-joining DNA ligase n=1 Tax=Mycobacterium sp. SMC-17 TaxID=3381628 RepID=UPI00387646E8
MLPTLGEPPVGPAWATEVKWDGFRSLVSLAASGVDVYTRNLVNASSTFPELDGLRDALAGRQAVLDGELVVLDPMGRPSFSRLQQRWPMRRRPSAALIRSVPVRFLAFDVLALDERDVTGLVYRQRRELLEGLGAGSAHPVLVVPPSWTDVAPSAMLAIAQEQGLEGVVAKRIDSVYVSGRSRAWIKTPIRRTCELAIVGWSQRGGPGGGGQIGNLLLAGRGSDGGLTVVGEVGTGFSAAERRRLYQMLITIGRSAAAAAAAPEDGWNWVEPQYVGEVAYREYVPGRGLRHCSWKGLRDRAKSPGVVGIRGRG